MAEKAQELLAGAGWLPEPLRTPGRAMPSATEAEPVSAADVVAPTEDGDGESDPPADDGDAEGFDEADEERAFAAE